MMPGVIALHGGGEFLPGDEATLRRLLELAPHRPDGSIRVAVVPTAAARGRPGLAAANGIAAFLRVGAASGIAVAAEAVAVVDASSAADPDLADRLAAADLIHLPGGDPDLIPALYPGTEAWSAIRTAHDGGALIAGASAGAMALGESTWTRAGLVRGLGLVPGVIVAPHADAGSWAAWCDRIDRRRHPGVAILGLGERTAVLVPGDGDGDMPWSIVGEGEARWLAAASDGPLVARSGDTIVARA